MKVFHVHADLALIHERFIRRVNEFDRVFDRQNMDVLAMVHVVEHRSDRRRFTRTSHTGEQHHPLVVVRQLGHDRRQIESIEVRNRTFDFSANHARQTHLHKEIHAKSPLVAIDINDVRKVGATFVPEDVRQPLIHHRHEQRFHFLLRDWLHI